MSISNRATKAYSGDEEEENDENSSLKASSKNRKQMDKNKLQIS